jgi:hypothetical protein
MRRLRNIALFGGNTILGDGAVIMIIDPNGLANAIGSTASAQQAAENAREIEQRTEGASTESLLVFRAGSPQPKAVHLSLVTRLEEIDAKTIEGSDGRLMVQYRGQLMPLVLVNEDVRIKEKGVQPLLVFADEGRSMGLVVDEIVDIVGGAAAHRARQPASGRARLRDREGAGHRGCRHRALSAARLRRLDGLGRRAHGAGAGPRAADRRCAVLPQHAGPRAQGGGLCGDVGCVRRGGACAVRGR